MDFSNLNARDAKVTIVSIGNVNEVTSTEGMTIREFKEANGLVGKTLVNEEGTRLNDTDTVTDNLQVFVATPKQNG